MCRNRTQTQMEDTDRAVDEDDIDMVDSDGMMICLRACNTCCSCYQMRWDRCNDCISDNLRCGLICIWMEMKFKFNLIRMWIIWMQLQMRLKKKMESSVFDWFHIHEKHGMTYCLNWGDQGTYLKKMMKR